MDQNNNFNPAPQQNKPSGCSVAGLVLACIAFVLMFIGIVFYWMNLAGIIIGLIAMILSIVGMKKDTSKGVSIAGLVISLVSLLVNIILFAACGICVLAAVGSVL